jgi:2'-5' RNA ligase
MDVYGIALVLPDKIGKELEKLRNGFGKYMYYIPIPHITLIHPFIPKVSLKLISDRLSQIAERTKPFRLSLSGIEYSEHIKNKTQMKAHITIITKQPIIDLYHAINSFIIGPLKDSQGNLILDSYSPELIIGQNIPDDVFPKIKKKLSKETAKFEVEVSTLGLFIRNPEFATNQGAEWTLVEEFQLTG